MAPEDPLVAAARLLRKASGCSARTVAGFVHYMDQLGVPRELKVAALRRHAAKASEASARGDMRAAGRATFRVAVPVRCLRADIRCVLVDMWSVMFGNRIWSGDALAMLCRWDAVLPWPSGNSTTTRPVIVL